MCVGGGPTCGRACGRVTRQAFKHSEKLWKSVAAQMALNEPVRSKEVSGRVTFKKHTHKLMQIETPAYVWRHVLHAQMQGAEKQYLSLIHI